ncbi:dihydrofolate reductase family protein [Jiangella sp. DSM 45060]|uniref:dihydrofolate reductase family protein n=1 Tax=Jiangella sp. DSM 45060 TaxID=1798224 RepID=UPI00087BCA81|nr:dihydrofolate reductase family protein [Jiangella sp. DSM 45060]SDT65027.1 Dihydrofolate reductase [Jiangella sp. DSM 45060]
MQTSTGKVQLAFMMSLDGFVAGPGHSMGFMDGTTVRDGVHRELIESTGAILAGRDGYDSTGGNLLPYGGAWSGPIFVLTHHPEDVHTADGATVLSCSAAEAVRIGLEAARGRNLQVFSPTIGRQLLRLGLVDEIDVHVAPVLLGDGIRLYDAPGGELVRLARDGDGPGLAARLRYRPASSVSRVRRSQSRPSTGSTSGTNP